jgi:very-short-patch-repair endonuclease
VVETRLWQELRAKRLDGWKFKRQVPIDRYVADFACPSAYLIVEVDGPVHDTAERKLKDSERDATLRRLGYRVLRFSSEMAVATMIAGIRDALSAPSPDPRAGAGVTLPPMGGGQR